MFDVIGYWFLVTLFTVPLPLLAVGMMFMSIYNAVYRNSVVRSHSDMPHWMRAVYKFCDDLSFNTCFVLAVLAVINGFGVLAVLIYSCENDISFANSYLALFADLATSNLSWVAGVFFLCASPFLIHRIAVTILIKYIQIVRALNQGN